MKAFCLILLITIISACSTPAKKIDHQVIKVKKITSEPKIDGQATESLWRKAPWHAINQNWQGKAYDYSDFHGRYKLVWNESALYVLIETTDNVFLDLNEDPLKLWWNDDSLQIFIDEDNSGGLHQYNYNAFAFNVSSKGDVVDLTPNQNPALFNDVITTAKLTDEQLTRWELKIQVYDTTYLRLQNNIPKQLSQRKKIGFALAYNDNDEGEERENLIGSVFIPGENKNIGWIDSDVLGTLILVD